MSLFPAERSTVPVWDEGDWSPLPILTGSCRADVCVVGLGGSGLAVIAALSERGMRVIGIDAIGVAGGAAGRNGGFLLAGLARFYHETVAVLGRDRAAAIYRCTIDEIDRLERTTPTHIRRRGSLRIACDAAELADCDAHAAALRADGFAVESYAGSEGQGLLLPTDAAFNPISHCRALAREVLSKGAALHEFTPAIDFKPGAVLIPNGRIEAAHIIIAVDGRLEQLLPELQGRVRTARLQMLGTAPAHEIDLPRPVYARWGYDYWQQTVDKRIVLGGFRDRALADEWTYEATPSDDVQQRLERYLREQLRITAPVTHRWAASVGYTSDGLPIVEEVRAGLWAVGGYNGTGNIVGALCARGVAELIATGTSRFIGLLKGC